MPDGPTVAPIPDDTQLAELQKLYDVGRYLDAYAICTGQAPLAAWKGSRALTLAGRLASQWGDESLSRRLHQRAFREDPADCSTIYYQGQTILGKHGVFEALMFVRRYTALLPPVPENRPQAYVWLLYARLLGIYRDFSTADSIMERVLARFPDDPWVWVDKADFLENQDRYPEALAAAEQAVLVQPWYRPAVQAQAHLLQLMERDDEAISLLRSAMDRLQSGRVVQMLVIMLEENGRLDELPPLLDEVARCLPLPDTADRRWLAARRCMAAHRRGETAMALEWARKNGSAYYTKIAERLADAKAPGCRVQLPVGFIRQHYMTCAPATLTALSQYWGRPAEHQDVARAICYDGSPDHVERDWAEKQGWLVREFRPTWEIARQLLDRGCPFAVVTVETDSAHMQAVIGYDSTLETLLIRDPYFRNSREWLAENFFESYAAHGPRAMLMLPPEKAGLVHNLLLPDTDLYDQYYRLRRALHAHERPEAEAALEALRRIAADHLLTLWGGYELAHYDGRLGESLEMVRRIREKHPANGNWRLAELRLRERLGDQVAHRTFLHEAGVSRSALVPIRRDYAEDLARDARQHGRARRILRSLLRREAVEPRNLRAYANLLWGLRDLEESTLLYRLAACRADKVEFHWDSYFIACRHMGRTDEALGLLQTRVTRWGSQSSQPARTLFDSLNALERTDEGFRVLEIARQLRPHDGELLLFMAEAFCRYGRHTEALPLLEAARTREARPVWLRSAARIADYQRDHPGALVYWRELAALNPADTNAHSAVARLLAITAGEAAAVVHLREACALRPHLLPLHQLLVERLREAPAETALLAVERMLALDPGDAWALREKALVLRRLRRLAEALDAATAAVHIAPNTPSSHGVLADILDELGRKSEAHASYRTGIRLSIDADWLYARLLATCDDFQARRNAVMFLHQELMRQNSLDSASLQFRASARTIVGADELTAMLREYHATHPEIWAAWSSLGTHLLEAGALSEAAILARAATDRFPLVPRAWTDLAEVHAKAGETDAEIAAIQKALGINPAWSQASRQLASAYERRLQLDQAEHVLRRATAANPLDPVNHAWLADVLWRLRRPAEALAAIEAALALNPDYGWAWDRLADWGRQQGDAARARRLAKHLTETRSGEAGPWLRLVHLAYHDPDITENLQALDRAAALTPLDTEVWDLRACLLADRLEYDAALAACRPTSFDGKVPYVLEGRAAWIEHRRGRIDEAITRMKSIVETHPDYAWGWGKLTEWHWAKKDFEAVREPAEKWAWLNPKAAQPHGYLAVVHQKAGRRQEAKVALTRSLALDPQYSFGANELLKMHLDDSEFTEARQVLTHYATHYSPWESAHAEIQLHIAAKDRPKARAVLARLGTMPQAAQDDLKHAVTLLLDAGWAEEADEALRPLLRIAETQSMVADQWMRARKSRNLPWRTFGYLLRRKHAPAMRETLLGAYVSWLGEKNLKLRLQLACLLWHRTLARNIESWGQTGYALSSANLNRLTAYWLRDWPDRNEGLAPWMLNNLVLSLLGLGRVIQANAVMDRALRLPADNVSERIMCLRCCTHAVAGETKEAANLLDRINPSDKNDYYKPLLTLTRQLLSVQQAEPAARRTTADNAVASLQATVAEYPNLVRDPVLKRLYRCTLDRIGRDGAKPWLRIRSRLPLLAPSTGSSQSSETGFPWWMFFVGYLVVSALLRSCS